MISGFFSLIIFSTYMNVVVILIAKLAFVRQWLFIGGQHINYRNNKNVY